MTTIQAFFQTPVGYAIYVTLATAAVAFVSGVAAAVRDGTFTLQAIDAFVRADLLGRVVPIFIFLFGGYLLGADPAGAALTAAGLAASAAYVAATAAAVLAKWAGTQKQGVPQE
jgi:hypothetical protein